MYEKRLIEAYISEHGSEPSTNEPLASEDLIDLKGSNIIRPRPPTLTSIPALLGVFQEEWDALALETYTLKQNLAQTRQELSTALYQHDAAVRVIARLTRERDEAREALSKVSVGRRPAVENGDAMQVDSNGLPENVVARVEATQETYDMTCATWVELLTDRCSLSKTRRKRPIPDGWATLEDISAFKPNTPSEVLYSGVRSVSIDDSGDLALLGGADGIAGIYSIPERKVLKALKGGGGAITDAVWASSTAIISTLTGKVTIFSDEQEPASFQTHAGETTALAVHPSGDLLASAGVDKSYILYDLSGRKVISQTFSDSGTAHFHSLRETSNAHTF